MATEHPTAPIEHQAEAPGAKRSRPRRRPSPGSVIWGSVGLFAVLFSMLTYQLSSAMQAAPTATSARPVLMRRVVKRRIVTRVVPAQAAAGTTTQVSSAPSATSSPVTAAPAPVTTSAS